MLRIKCLVCSGTFEAKRSTRKYCSDACKTTACERGLTIAPLTVSPSEPLTVSHDESLTVSLTVSEPVSLTVNHPDFDREIAPEFACQECPTLQAENASLRARLAERDAYIAAIESASDDTPQYSLTYDYSDTGAL